MDSYGVLAIQQALGPLVMLIPCILLWIIPTLQGSQSLIYLTLVV